MYDTYSQDRAHIPDIQTPTPHRTTQELIQAYGRGRGQAHREQLHGTDPLEPVLDPYRAGFRGKSKRQRYANTQ